MPSSCLVTGLTSNFMQHNPTWHGQRPNDRNRIRAKVLGQVGLPNRLAKRLIFMCSLSGENSRQLNNDNAMRRVVFVFATTKPLFRTPTHRFFLNISATSAAIQGLDYYWLRFRNNNWGIIAHSFVILP